MTMEMSMLVLLRMEKNMAKANIHLPMDFYTWANSRTISFMVKALIYYQVG